MKILSIRVNELELPVVCANVFDTNDCFKANMVLDISSIKNKKDLNTLESNDFEIRGMHFDYSDLLLDGDGLEEKLTIDFEEIHGDWALCFVSC